MRALFLLSLSAWAALGQTVITEWNFNSLVPDAAPATGALEPSSGRGSAMLEGGVTATFATGDAKRDPAVSDNSGWNTSGYPPAAAGNLTAGVRFDADTTGFENIVLSWSQRNSASASRWGRVQYTLDGYTFADLAVTLMESDSMFAPFTADFTGIPGAADNPLFGVRIVAEWESTATGAGAGAYAATKQGSNYSPSGTVRFDMVRFTGTLSPWANTPPVATAISNQTLRVNIPSPQLPFEIGDAQEDAAGLTVTAETSDPCIVPFENIILGGSGTNRWVSVTPGSEPGSATIRLTVTDTGGCSTTVLFCVTVLPENTPPHLSGPQRLTTVLNSSAETLWTVGDAETDADLLTLSATSEHPAIVPDSGIAFSGAGSNRVLSVTPSPGQMGVAVLKVCASDGQLGAEARIAVMVLPSAATLVFEPFDYEPGSLLTRSPYWATRSGVAGQAVVTNGALLVTSSLSEDVVAPLAGGVIRATNGVVLYSSFRVTALGEPASRQGLLAHFANGSTLRGRVYVSVTNAAPGAYRLSVANGSAETSEWPGDCLVGVTYAVVTRYDVDAAATTLWVNPASEADPSITGGDPQTPASIASYGFRQDADVGGDFLVDDLRVALTFADAVGLAVRPPRLAAAVESGEIVLSWEEADCVLETSAAPEGPYEEIFTWGGGFRAAMTEPARFYRLKRRTAAR